MKKEILIIAATHGDEKIGIEVINELKKEKLNNFFDYMIANSKALEINKRYLDKDLNRSYPGKKFSRFYEKRVAYRNLMMAKKYRYVIDIHEASKGKDDFIIVPKENLKINFPLNYIKLNTILLWPDPKGSISQALNNAVELEFGSKNRDRKEMINKAVRIIKNFIYCINKNEKVEVKENKKVFFVYGLLKKEDFNGDMGSVIDFEQIDIDGEKFLPLLVGQYLNLGIVCYKMKKASKF